LGISKIKKSKRGNSLGVACGSAATMNEGTQLFKKEDAQRLFEWLNNKYIFPFYILYNLMRKH
jgi:6-phosphofructokinase 2